MTGQHQHKRIAVIGPVTPYRSGVAKHTTELAQALARAGHSETRVFSFSRLYPALLFPGQDPRAPDLGAPEGLDITWGLDSINPLTWRTAARHLSAFQPDLAVLPAWTFFVGPCLGYLARHCRRLGAEVTQVVHNAADHETAWWKRRLSQLQLSQATRFVTHNTALAGAVRETVPGLPIAIHPHPVFTRLPDPLGTLPRRASLELLAFGLVRPYKGFDIALKGLANSGLSDVRLSIVGEVWEGRRELEALIADLGLTERIELVPRYVTDAEAAEYFHRADAVLLPYRSVSGSGVVPVAYRYGRPVIVSDLAGLTEIVREGETGWIVPRDAPEALGQLLATHVTAAAKTQMQAGIQAARAAMSWDSFADCIVQAGQPAVRGPRNAS